MFKALLILALLLVMASQSAQAHDPGLSSARVKIDADFIHVFLTFAPADIEAISGLEFPAGHSISAGEKSRLIAIAGQSFEILLDQKAATLLETNVAFLSNGDVEFGLKFRSTPAARLLARSTLMDRLPFGHRQYLTIADAQNPILAEKLLGGANEKVEVTLTVIANSAPSHPFSEFVGMGVKHILTGYDHLLFLFALLVGCKRISSILKVITAFTVAHSISLALATLGWVEIPSRVVEALIAATIVYVALENLIRGQAVSHRVLLTFGFGLVHGFGFASALREMGVGSNGSAVAIPLVGFNTGVEIGQMLVAAVILPVLWRIKDKPQFVIRWAPACSVLIALAGSFWFIQRVWMN